MAKSDIELTEELKRKQLWLVRSFLAAQVVAALFAIFIATIVIGRPSFLDGLFGSKYPIGVAIVFGLATAMVMFVFSLQVLIESKRRRPNVFVSFSYEDLSFVDPLIRRLKDQGVSVLRPEETIRVGDNIEDRIRELMSRCSHVIVVVSQKYEESKWAAIELGMLRRRIKVLPILYKTNSVPPGLEKIAYVRADEVTEELIERILPSLPVPNKKSL